MLSCDVLYGLMDKPKCVTCGFIMVVVINSEL